MENNKIIWCSGQGIDGVGSTAFQIELSKLFKFKKLVNYKTNAKYNNSKNFNFQDFEIIETQNIFNELKDLKIILVNSFPNTKNSLEEIDLFYDELEKLHNNGNILVGFMHFNTLAYMNRIPKMLLGINFLDYIFTFDVNSKFGNIIKKHLPYKQDRLRPMEFVFETLEFKNHFKKNQCIYLGRYATFKRPEGMIKLKKQNTTNTIFSCYGIGRTIESLNLINNSLSYYHKSLQDAPIKNNVNIYGIIKHDEGMMKLRESMFSYSGFHLDKNDYGQRFEFAMMEMIDNECICIFDEHFLKNVFLNGKSLYDYDIFIPYNENKVKEINLRMKEILLNETLRIQIVKKQKEILKEMTNPDKVLELIFGQIKEIDKNTLSKNKFLNYLIGDKMNIPNIAYDISDLNRKDTRIYIQIKSRLKKIIKGETNE